MLCRCGSVHSFSNLHKYCSNNEQQPTHYFYVYSNSIPYEFTIYIILFYVPFHHHNYFIIILLFDNHFFFLLYYYYYCNSIIITTTTINNIIIIVAPYNKACFAVSINTITRHMPFQKTCATLRTQLKYSILSYKRILLSRIHTFNDEHTKRTTQMVTQTPSPMTNSRR